MSLDLASLVAMSDGFVPPSTMEDALRRQALAGGGLDTALLETGARLSESECLRFLEKASGFPGIDGPSLMGLGAAAAALLPGELAERHCLLPLHTDGQRLHVAVPFPASQSTLDEVRVSLRCELSPRVALEARLREAIARVYDVPLAERFTSLIARLGPVENAARATATLRPSSPTAGDTLRPAIQPLKNENINMTAALEKALANDASDPPPSDASTARKGPEGQAAIATRIAGAAEDAPPSGEEWTFDRAKVALEAAGNRDAIIEVALRFYVTTFDFAAAFAIVGGTAEGWSAFTADGISPDTIEQISIPLDAPSVLRTVLVTRGRYLGPLPSDPLSSRLVAGRLSPSLAFVCPIEMRGRPVAILYADATERRASDDRIAELVALTNLAGRRLEKLILESKRKLGERAASVPPSAPPSESSGTASNLEPPPPSASDLFARSPAHPRRSPETQRGTAARTATPIPAPISAPGLSRMAPAPAPAPSTAPTAPSMDELYDAVEKMIGSDPGERARALRILQQAPEIAAALLAARFPGPVLPRVPTADLPAPEDLGPVPAALVRMGGAAARALIPLLEYRDVDCRHIAVLTAGRLQSPTLVAPVARRIFDPHPVVGGAARVALRAMRQVAGFDKALNEIRGALNGGDCDAAASAARALGFLHDLQAVEKMIELTGHPEKSVAQAAADALKEITKQKLGTSPSKWKSWWFQHGSQPRTSWLIEGLDHRDLEVRLSAIDELVRVVNDNLGYFANGRQGDRKAGVKRWIAWYEAAGRHVVIV